MSEIPPSGVACKTIFDKQWYSVPFFFKREEKTAQIQPQVASKR